MTGEPLPDNYPILSWWEKFHALQLLPGFRESACTEKPAQAGIYQVIQETDYEPSIGWCLFNGRIWGIACLNKVEAEIRGFSGQEFGCVYRFWRAADMPIPTNVRTGS